MRRLHVADSVPADAQALGPEMRQADRDEVMAASGMGPEEALAHGIYVSAECRTVLAGGRPIAVFGVVNLGSGEGAPWLLGSDRILDHWFEFARRSREELVSIRQPWTRLGNWIDDRNELHKRWLAWLGFEFKELALHYGVGKLPFWRFESV